MRYSKITISGKICTGKSTLFQSLEKKLQWKTFHSGKFFRNYVNKHKLNLEMAQEQNVNLTKKIDYMMRDILKNKGNWLFDSWMAGIMADNFPAVLRILLVCDDRVRFKRFAEREKVSIKVAKKDILNREANLFKKLEQIHKRNDFVDQKNYNLIINTTRLSPNQILHKVLNKLM